MNLPCYCFTALTVAALIPCARGSDHDAPPGSTSKAGWVLTYSSRDQANYHGLSFPDATHGWMVGDSGTILHSHDAGKSWELQASPSKTQLTCVQFVNERVGWTAGQSNTVLRTADGGRTWGLDHPAGGPARRTFMALSFVDEQQGWIAHNYGGLLHTRDGGRTWKAQDHLSPDALLSICFRDAKHGWALSIGGRLLRTTDSGQTWASQQLSAPPHATVSFSALFLLDDSHGWIGTDTQFSSRAGDLPPLFRTTDGGRTWAVQGHWPGSSRPSLWFQNTQSGWCAEMSGIYSTRDGGLSWTKELGSGGDPFVQLVFAGTHGWALTFSGNVYTYSG